MSKEDLERAALGRRLKDAREYAGFSQEEIAKHLSVSRSAISLVESGDRRLRAMELQKLSALYQRSMEDLTGQAVREEDDHNAVRVLARAAEGLSDEDRAEVLRFAEFLRQRQSDKK